MLYVQAMTLMRRLHNWWLWRRAYRSIPGHTPEERGDAVMRMINEMQARRIADEAHQPPVGQCGRCNHPAHGTTVCGWGRGKGPNMCGCVGVEPR